MIEINKENVLSIYNEKSEMEQTMLNAEAIMYNTPDTYVYAESFYTYESPVTYGMKFWECFFEEDDFEEEDDVYILMDKYMDYDEVYEILLEHYKEIVHDVFKEMKYDEVKTLIHCIQYLIGVYKESSLVFIIDNEERILERYESLRKIFKLAGIDTQQCDMYWFDILYEIGLEYLYEDWFDDLISKTSYISQSIFIEPIGAGLEAIGLDIDKKDLRENWKCYQKIIKYIVPDEKKKIFSKACREQLMEYERLRNVYDI